MSVIVENGNIIITPNDIKQSSDLLNKKDGAAYAIKGNPQEYPKGAAEWE